MNQYKIAEEVTLSERRIIKKHSVARDVYVAVIGDLEESN